MICNPLGCKKFVRGHMIKCRFRKELVLERRLSI
jgi:hypothetical protein